MKSIFKKLAVITFAAAMVFGAAGCSTDSSSDNSALALVMAKGSGSSKPAKQTVATPTFNPAAGAVNSGTTVTISCSTEGAVIHYTTDGSTPTASSATYSAAISITEGVTIRAIAVKSGMNNSEVASAEYTIKGTVATPIFDPATGTALNDGDTVTISCSTEGVKIYYTTDGSEPTTSSTEYTSAVSVTPSVTIKAIAVKDGLNNSAVASASYTVKQTVATPTISPAAGAVNSGTSVTISCTTEGAVIHYTTDGSEPTASSTAYSTAISITTALTIKAIAVKSGMNNSAVASASYTVKQTVATPTISPAAGAVNSGTSVTISCTTEGAVIHYTTDGSEPTASSTTYSSAISITTAQTIKAIAVKSGMNNSEVASASYLIIPTKDTCVPGDFVLKDGTMLPKDITLSATQKANVAAVIVRAKDGGTPALGVGIVHNRIGLVWCTSSAKGYSTNITSLQGTTTSGYMDGNDGWEKLKAACSDAEEHPEYYPAWNYSLTYATTNSLTGDLADGWYLPTVAELYTIYSNKTVVDASLTVAGGNTFGTSYYWSCCQFSSIDYNAHELDFEAGYKYSSLKDSNRNYVCSVRAFN